MGVKMIRVLQVLGNMNIGGMESMLMNYYRNIDRSVVQFDFLLSDRGKCFYEDEIKALGGHVYKVTPRRKNPLKNRREMVDFFKNSDYDIIEIHQGVTYLLPLKLAKKFNIKNIIVHNHGVDSKYKSGLYDLFRKKIVIPYIAKTATAFFACSKLVLADLFSDEIIKNNKYTIVNNAIDVGKYQYNKNVRDKKRAELKAGDKYVVGHVGNFTYPKNQEFIMEIAKQTPVYMYVLIGDGKYLDSCKSQNVKNVIFCGARSDVNELMQAFDVFILPSRWEGLPLVAIEAQAAGLPVLLSENVSREAKLTDDVEFLPLDLRRWVEVINELKSYHRKDNCDSIKERGYDCSEEAYKLEKNYSNMRAKLDKVVEGS